MKIVFLDIDGVLNSGRRWSSLPSVEGADPGRKRIDRDSLPHLNAIAHDCSIVISSSWRYWKRPAQIRDCLLPFGLDPTIPFIDRTAKQGRRPRGERIMDWVRAHPTVTGFVALDDCTEMLAVFDHWTQTSWRDGLLAIHIADARRRLELPLNR